MHKKTYTEFVCESKISTRNLCNRPLVSICGEYTLWVMPEKSTSGPISYKQKFVKILYHYQHVASSVCSTVVHDHETFMKLAMNECYKYRPHPTPIRHLYDVINFYLPSNCFLPLPTLLTTVLYSIPYPHNVTMELPAYIFSVFPLLP